MEDQRIIELLAEISRDLKTIACLLGTQPGADRSDPANWWTAQQTMKFLGNSIRNLYTLRHTGELTWIKKGRQYFYFRPDVLALKPRFLK